MKNFGAIVKRSFISGVLVVVPVILTYIVLKFLFEAIDGLLRPLIFRAFGYDLPLLGFITLLLIILLVGIGVRSYVGNRIYRIGDRLLKRLPLIRPFYSAARQLLDSVTGSAVHSFKDVALIEYPSKGMWSLGFVANHVHVQLGDVTRQCAVVFVPSTPTPISGMAVIVPLDEVHPVDLSIEQCIKFLVSGGVASPELIKDKAKTVPTS